MIVYPTIKSIRTIAAVIALGVSMAALPSAFAAPESTGVGTTPLGITTLINSVGDDVFSTTNLSTLTAAVDPSTTSTQHYGPYSSGSTDSGTCGNDWANDMFNRHFTVFKEPDGTLAIVEQFKDGSFVTPAADSPPTNFSPGACQNSPVPQGTVKDGITGSLHGYFIIPLPAGTVQTSTSPYCNATTNTNANCDTSTFINTHFTPCYPTTCTVTTFFFHYAAGDQGLIINEWKNASPDRGGNNGDIRSTNI